MVEDDNIFHHKKGKGGEKKKKKSVGNEWCWEWVGDLPKERVKAIS